MSIANTLAPRAGELYSHTAIRGVAALCVVGYHAIIGSAGMGYTNNPLQNFFLTSFIFVDFFFILSGFIMYENYGKKISGPNVVANSILYWKRRLSKILPNYYFWLIVAVGITYLKWYSFEERTVSSECVETSLIQHFLLVQNLVGSCHYFNPPLWSVAVEVIAYLVFPIVILLRMNWALTLIVGSALYGVFYYFSDEGDNFNGYFSIVRCLAGFLCGVAAAKISTRIWSDFINLPMIILLVWTIALNYQILALIIMFLVTILTANNTGIVAKVSQMKLPYLIGRSSFSIYLAHYPVAMVVIPVAYKLENLTGIPLGSEWKVMMPFEIIMSSIVGVLAYAYVETRLERLFAISNRPLQIA